MRDGVILPINNSTTTSMNTEMLKSFLEIWSIYGSVQTIPRIHFSTEIINYPLNLFGIRQNLQELEKHVN